MSIKEIADLVLNANRAIDVFGEGDENDIKKVYKKYVKVCHPDLNRDNSKMCEDIMSLLNKYYHEALEELKNGTYNIKNEKELLKLNTPLFEFDIKNKHYTFYKYLKSDDVCDIYEGLLNDELITLKIVMDESDNELLESEYDLVSDLEHYSINKPICKVKINGRVGLIYNKPNAYNIIDFKKHYGCISGSHLCWVLERLLSILGYLHSNKIVHGNIKEENVYIDADNHNVILDDFALAIKNASDPNSKYKIINDHFTPSYVDASSRVIPNADIYAVGIIAIDLLGGDIDRIALPISCDERVRRFIRKLLDKNENDAWKLWNELIEIRNEVYGLERFKKLNKRK